MGMYVFDLTSSTLGTTITLEQLLAGGGTSIMQTVTGTGRFLELQTGTLAANTSYRFLYTFNAPGAAAVRSAVMPASMLLRPPFRNRPPGR